MQDNTPRPNTTDCLPVIRTYEIEKILFSHPSRLIFIKEENSERRLVIKILIKDTSERYNLATIEDRQKAQLYALQWNRCITSDVYLGVAHISGDVLDCLSPQGVIALGPIIEDPEPEDLIPSLEYALVMRCLPEDRQLSTLLRFNAAVFHSHYILPITTIVANKHEMFEALSISDDPKEDWGSCRQLQAKLTKNIKQASRVLVKQPVQQALFTSLTTSLLEVFDHSLYRGYFEQRRHDKRIKRCHGDLKAQNIWIVSSRVFDGIGQGVKILDAIDFNPVYTNIDILSDFAMLVIDVQSYTHSASLADDMIELYLKLAKQEDKETRFVLNYYLLEKILVRAAIRSASESLSESDETFLEIARGHLERLHKRIKSHQFIRM